MFRLALLLLAAACAVSAQQLDLAGTATFFSPASDVSSASCMFPAGTPTGWAGQVALSINSSLTLQARATAVACCSIQRATRAWVDGRLLLGCPAPPPLPAACCRLRRWNAPHSLPPATVNTHPPPTAAQSSPLGACGTCLAVSAGNASAVVQVVDACSSCAATDLTLDAATFAALGGSSADGALAVTYRPTECRPPPGTNMTVTLLDYRASEGGYLRLVLSNVAGSSGIQAVETRQTPLAVRGAAGCCLV